MGLTGLLCFYTDGYERTHLQRQFLRNQRSEDSACIKIAQTILQLKATVCKYFAVNIITPRSRTSRSAWVAGAALFTSKCAQNLGSTLIEIHDHRPSHSMRYVWSPIRCAKSFCWSIGRMGSMGFIRPDLYGNDRTHLQWILLTTSMEANRDVLDW